jgi:hypothetical protein
MFHKMLLNLTRLMRFLSTRGLSLTVGSSQKLFLVILCDDDVLPFEMYWLPFIPWLVS